MAGNPALGISQAASAGYVIDIPNWHPTPLNKLLGHWRMPARRKKQDREMVWAYVTLAHVPIARATKRSVELIITLAPKQRALDVDAYFKSTLDALVNAHVLWDDSRQYCELLPVKFERGRAKATRIVLREIA